MLASLRERVSVHLPVREARKDQLLRTLPWCLRRAVHGQLNARPLILQLICMEVLMRNIFILATLLLLSACATTGEAPDLPPPSRDQSGPPPFIYHPPIPPCGNHCHH